MAVRIIACSHFLPSWLIVSSWLSQKPLVAGWVTAASGITFWPRFPEEQHILDSRAFYMHSPCCGGCGNVTVLPSLMWGAKWMKADCPWEAALWSTCSQNTGNISSSTSVSITFILSFLLISFGGRVRILSPLCPLIRSKEELAGARVISEDLSARDLRSSCMKQTCVKEEACFLKVWRDGCWWDALCLHFKGYLRIQGPLRGVHSCSSLYCMSALPIGFSCLLSLGQEEWFLLCEHFLLSSLWANSLDLWLNPPPLNFMVFRAVHMTLHLGPVHTVGTSLQVHWKPCYATMLRNSVGRLLFPRWVDLKDFLSQGHTECKWRLGPPMACRSSGNRASPSQRLILLLSVHITVHITVVWLDKLSKIKDMIYWQETWILENTFPQIWSFKLSFLSSFVEENTFGKGQMGWHLCLLSLKENWLVQ